MSFNNGLIYSQFFYRFIGHIHIKKCERLIPKSVNNTDDEIKYVYLINANKPNKLLKLNS